MSARSKGRKRALDILYESDIKGVNPLWLVNERVTGHDEISSFARSLVEGFGSESTLIDELINKHARNWDIDRLASVDRNILRIATLEILKSVEREVPISVAIDEALEMAKELSTDDSPRYIHGILSAIAKEVSQAPTA
jgi:N utilization substance protein B